MIHRQQYGRCIDNSMVVGLDVVYNRLIINNGSQKHNYICKYNNLPTTCFGLIRPSVGWKYSVRGKLSVWSKCRCAWGGRDLVYKYGVSAWNGVGTSVCPLGEFFVGRLAHGPTDQQRTHQADTHLCQHRFSH